MESTSAPTPASGPDPLLSAASGLFGVRYLYPAQRYVVSNILEGRNQIAVLPTGSGKSLCFQLPAMLAPGVTVVLVPILSLLADQVRRLEERGLRAGVLRGGQTPLERRALREGLAGGTLKILYATPEVMLTRSARDLLSGLAVSNLVVDEAHCVCEWGETFRPAYLRLAEVADLLGPTVLTALTATGSPDIVSRVRDTLFVDRDVLLFVGNPDRPNISYEVRSVLSRGHALESIARESERPLIVFARSRKSVERYARLLRRRLGDPEVRFYHAGLDREERRAVEAWFLPSRRGILTATSAYGMGVDKPDIRTVVHAEIPPSPEAYLQESGRAGRDGGPSRAVLLHSPADERFREDLADPVARKRYGTMVDYARASGECRRAFLLRAMGAELEHCSSCDVCDGREAAGREGEAAALRALAGQRRRFAREEAVHFLAGGESYRSLRLGLGRYRGFGALGGWGRDDVEELLEELLQGGGLRIVQWGPWKGKLTVPPAGGSREGGGTEGGGAMLSGTRRP